MMSDMCWSVVSPAIMRPEEIWVKAYENEMKWHSKSEILYVKWDSYLNTSNGNTNAWFRQSDIARPKKKM